MKSHPNWNHLFGGQYMPQTLNTCLPLSNSISRNVPSRNGRAQRFLFEDAHDGIANADAAWKINFSNSKGRLNK